jgi:lipoprotein-releasing system permease protein
MNGALIWQLALRYLRGKRSGNAVPILSRISMVAIAVGSCAMIVLFSVFNGFESLVKDLYKAFYPDVKISAAKGKFFSLDAQQVASLKKLQDVDKLTYVIEDNTLLKEDDNLADSSTQQIPVTVKGIDENYFAVNDVRQYITAGRDSIHTGNIPTAILGSHVAALAGADVNEPFSRIMLYYPNTKMTNPIDDPANAFQSLRLKPDGLFRIQDDFDSKYILAPLPLVQTLFGEEGMYSSVEIKLLPGQNANKTKRQLAEILGSKYQVLTRFEQNKTLYVVMNTEKWAVYAILLFVLLIASFNMIGALSLLVLEKQKDMAILKAMGAQPSAIRKIFVLEGVLWALTGGIAGILLGTLLCLGQQHFKWIKLGGAFIIDAYPVHMQIGDLLLVIATIITVGLLASWYPAARATRVEDPSLKST